MNRWAIRIILCCIVALIVPAFAFVYCYTWFLPPGGSSEIIDGMVGIRNYFYSGDGSRLSPFEITSPIHLYNLSRLQSLGIFSNDTYHFRIGTRVNYGTEEDPNYQYRCIKGYDDSGNPVYSNHLDMSGFEDIIEPIGSESTPFYGYFDGMNLPVRNLTVTGKPEDIGVFGYISYESKVENLILDTLTVKSLGYSKSSGDNDYKTFHDDIDPLFAEGGSYFKTANISFADSSSTVTSLKNTTVYEKNNVNAGMAGGESPNYIYDGSFKLVKPTYSGEGEDPFTYTLRSSTPIIEVYGEDSDFARLNLEPLATNADFNGETAHYSASSRISIVATIENNGISYSRVIQSYIVTFVANPAGAWSPGTNDWADGNVKMSITCAYIEDTDGPYPYVNYHHGNNIGFIAGHVDGSLENCYVYKGAFELNDSGFNPIYTETQSGLIGEIGSDVSNSLDPSDESGKGERGVLDITGIYNTIRNNFSVGDVVRAGTLTDNPSSPKMISYQTKLNPTASLYSKYLRYDDFPDSAEGREFITNGSDLGTNLTKGYEAAHNYNIPSFDKVGINSVDFLWNQVIEEGSETINGVEEERGLGVFKIVSSYIDLPDNYTISNYGTYMTSGLGGSAIYNMFDKDRITDVFYSTAEIDWSKSAGENPWGDGVTPLKMANLPSYCDLGTFRYPFSRDFNYVFKLDLSDSANTDENRQYYMFNNNSPFLTNYLSTVLVDRYGMPVPPSTSSGANEEFGFYFRERKDKALKYMQSYIVVSKPGNKQPYTLENGLTRYFPPNSIVFHIDNPNGANVSVVGNREDISIYSFDSISSTGGVSERYTMRSKNKGEENMHRYFSYNRTSGTVETENVPINGMKDTNAAFAHIFKLTEPGDYVIGASSKTQGNSTARIFYLAVQGQNEADLGKKATYITGNGIDNVDFLLDPPLSSSEYAVSSNSVDLDSLNKAQLSFQAYFDNSAGTGRLTVIPAINDEDKKFIRISFNDSTDFTSYILVNSKSLNPYFYLNSNGVDKVFVSSLGKYPY